ncbi:dipeptidyl aminopeptidase B [Scheffersomyces stipitis CBS 6054]|uniref:Dipeptidyl aminopeptidase B n=1 Tax=Scheffersomyces stipitis (strain ATCC 58785 / CBS 6054 / NBRC 10063 / NRRL Y-11545) TaxID=322104 RepID=A3LXS8_PICST|nr:dipeptidyl aminopeptidase B [Scheffersomyces stipitis CBS 6054]ABN67851.2 dipeptidyl aminopeptidase B [Scheffersomyces stipitis CBS 6054]
MTNKYDSDAHVPEVKKKDFRRSYESELDNEFSSRVNHYNYKNFFISGVLLSILIWGSSFLITAITNLRTTEILHHEYEQLLKANSPPLLQSRPAVAWDGSGKIPLNFSAVRDGKFRPNYKSLQWIHEPSSIESDKGTYVLKDDSNGHLEYTIKSIVDDDYSFTLYNGSTFNYSDTEYKIESLIASPDLTKAILKTNATHNWRHSSFALYWLLDISESSITPILDTTSKLAVTSWSPKSTDIAFIFDNNVYVKNIASGEVKQVTFDGSSQVFNGKPDWVYEEEVFAGDIVLWWSPSGDKFTFLKSNDTEVPEFTIPYYVQNGHEDYPEVVQIKYPKAGYPNPSVELVIYDLDTEKDQLLELKSEKIVSSDRLITEVVWVGSSVLVKTSNRASDLLEIFLVDSVQNESKIVRSLTADDSWFEVTSNTLFVPKNESLGRLEDGYVDTVVSGGFNHLAYFSPPSASEGVLLTNGQWEVVGGVEAFDFNKNKVYFVSTMKSSVERHIHSVSLFDKSNNGLPKVENITSGEGWFAGSFSSGSRYLLLTYEGPEVPYQKLIDLSSLKDVKTIESNQEVIDNLDDYLIPEVKYEVIELQDEETGEIFKANAIETLPLHFDSRHKYPVLFFVYGGPGSQLVTKNFAVSFSSVVAAELNAIVVTVDGRGTGYNNYNDDLGSQYKFIVRDKLGKYEPLDQIAAARLWSEKSYVDSDRIAIWGWSYGGFLTLKTLETDVKHKVFSYGVSIAPVTKWKLYDSIYTERYMRTPQENPAGYEIASIHNITNFEHVKKFFIGHGSGDDNVHVQNTLKLIDEFNLGNIENFDFMIFPDSDHSIRYHNGNKVVYDRILTFLRRAFNGEFA